MSTTAKNKERIDVAKKAVFRALAGSATSYTKFSQVAEEFPIPLTWDVVGSTYIQDKEDSDVDVLVLVDENPSELSSFSGWQLGGSRNVGSADYWESWKRIVKAPDGSDVVVNMILVGERDYFYAWIHAAEACRFLHLSGVKLTKGQVHGVHAIIMDESTTEVELEQRDY